MLKKLRRTICGRARLFWGEGGIWRQIQYKFFCEKWGFQYSLYKNLRKKRNNIFQNNRQKNYWGAWPLFREWDVGLQKWIQPYLWEKWYQIQLWNFFLKKPHAAEWKPKNQFWGTFSPISMILLDRLFPKKKKKKINPCLDLHQPCEFRENRFKTVICIVMYCDSINYYKLKI